MKLTNKDAYKLAEDLVEHNIKLTEFEINFVESMIKISNKPGVITLTIDQESLYVEINSKLLIGKLRSKKID